MSKQQHKSAEHRRLRVVHVVSGDLWAGAEVQVWQLLRAARQLDEVDIRAVLLNPGQLADRLSAAAVPVTVLDESRQSFPALTRAFLAFCRDWRPAVIHTHRRKEHVLGALAARTCDSALVGTVHGRNEFATLQPGARQRLLGNLERLVLARAHDRLVAVSDDLADELPGGSSHSVVIPNSIDEAAVRHAADEAGIPPLQPAGRVHLGFLGRLVPVKQIDRLVQMMALLEAEHTGHFALHIVGDGPLGDRLRETGLALGLQGSVIFHGFQANPLPILSRLQALIFASAHEGLPMSALESLALGVPVVGPPLASLERLVNESGAGRIATSASPRALANAVRALELAPSRQEAMAPSMLPTRYHIDQGLSATVRLWQQLARRHKS